MQETQDESDIGSMPGQGASPGERNDCPLQYSCLGSPMDWGAGRAPVSEAAESGTFLSWCLSFVCMVQRRVNIMGSVLLWLEFKNKRSLEVSGYILFCLLTRMFIKDWESKEPWHPEAGLVSKQGAALLPLDVKALTELQTHTGSPWEQKRRRQQTPVTAPPPTPCPSPGWKAGLLLLYQSQLHPRSARPSP